MTFNDVFSYQGRMRRLAFGLTMLILAVLNLVFCGVIGLIVEAYDSAIIVAIPVFLAHLIAAIFAMIKRAKDLDMNPVYLLLIAIPILDIVFFSSFICFSRKGRSARIDMGPIRSRRHNPWSPRSLATD